jgi:hypothetical protein
MIDFRRSFTQLRSGRNEENNFEIKQIQDEIRRGFSKFSQKITLQSPKVMNAINDNSNYQNIILLKCTSPSNYIENARTLTKSSSMPESDFSNYIKLNNIVKTKIKLKKVDATMNSPMRPSISVSSIQNYTHQIPTKSTADLTNSSSMINFSNIKSNFNSSVSNFQEIPFIIRGGGSRKMSPMKSGTPMNNYTFLSRRKGVDENGSIKLGKQSSLNLDSISTKANTRRLSMETNCKTPSFKLFRKDDSTKSILNPVIKERKNKSPVIPRIKSNIQLNQFLIRDFNVGGGLSPQTNKRKIIITEQFYTKQKEIKSKIVSRAEENFEKERINNFEEICELREDSYYSHSNLSSLELSKNNSYENINNFDFVGLKQEYNATKKRHEERIVTLIKENSKKLACMMDNISNSEYSDGDSEIKKIKPLLRKNLQRVIRVRNILKKRVDKCSDFIAVDNINKFKSEKFENDEIVGKTLAKMNPPSFVKTKFRNKTNEKYKAVDGRYFGIK